MLIADLWPTFIPNAPLSMEAMERMGRQSLTGKPRWALATALPSTNAGRHFASPGVTTGAPAAICLS